MKVITIPFHIGDLNAGTLEMDTIEFGAHVRLLIAHYQAGVEGLACDEKRLANLCGVSPKIWKRIRKNAMHGFHLVNHPNGDQNDPRLIHDRCVKVIEWIAEKSAKNRANAMKRNQKTQSNVWRMR